jgi:hypothetical protein
LAAGPFAIPVTEVRSVLQAAGIHASDTELRLVLGEAGAGDLDACIQEAQSLITTLNGVGSGWAAADALAPYATQTAATGSTLAAASSALATPAASLPRRRRRSSLALVQATAAATLIDGFSTRKRRESALAVLRAMSEKDRAASRDAALARAAAASGAVASYTNVLLVTEAALLAVAARLRKLRYRLLTSALGEGPFVCAVASIAAEASNGIVTMIKLPIV